MPRIIAIDDPADPRIEPYRDIRERDLVGRAGGFVAEGRVVIEKLVGSSGCRLDSLLIAAHRLPTMADLLARLDEDMPVFAASQAVINVIAGFPLHRGLLAIGRRVDPPDAGRLLAALPQAADILVLSAIANHDNMGGIFRNAAAFGVRAVLLDAACCDPLYRKAIRVSVGAALLVPFARLAPDTDIPGLLARHGLRMVALSPRGRIDLVDLGAAPRNAVLLGAEGPGLSARILDQGHSVRLSMAGDFDSLNVATTSGIVLHHLFVAARRGG
ncbi:TrmH family RNA methyltransferase [Sphingomonas quercus]|uniref:RNA methyltransferase n=1 Tax=Sphingomonas quercus TaxID=2842451 RepID=A0ABS6BJW9_9SPHN|nr:RNA methyltransferase [Sphingomonas quercus]MBU3077515.1 RNA methyltransferase [Sphingomonas quercus]